MAALNMHYYSYTLKHNTEITVFIPTPEGNEQITDTAENNHYHYEEGLPVVYLLHGSFGDCSSWSRFSCIERYAQLNRFIVVCASAENSWYQDMVYGPAYETFFTKELPGYIQSLFPASKKREETYIAGLSMGGYGAWFLALRHPELYSKAISISGSLDMAEVERQCRTGIIDYPFAWEAMFGLNYKIEGSHADLFTLYKTCKKGGLLPELYQACGTEDFLYGMNLEAKKRFEKMGAVIHYEEGPGRHDWNFWDQFIQKAFLWIKEN